MAVKPRKPRKPAAPTTPDPIEIAMEQVATGKGPSTTAERLLIKQTQLIDAQRRNENYGSALKVLTGLAGGAVALVLAVMVWQATRADGLVIRAFSVPPALAERGITGEAVASQLMDRLNSMAATAGSGERRRTVAGASGAISIQIPQTGVSLSQLNQWLKAALGRERHISGEVMIATDGALVLAVRNGDRPLPLLRGQPDTLGPLLQTSAEAVFAIEQPDTYAEFLIREGRLDEAAAYSEQRIETGDPDAQARAYDSLGGTRNRQGRRVEALEAFRKGIALDARPSWRIMGSISHLEMSLGHGETTARYLEGYLKAVRRRDPRDRLTDQARETRALVRGSMLAAIRRDYLGELGMTQDLYRFPIQGSGLGRLGGAADRAELKMQAHAGLHEVAHAQTLMTTWRPLSDRPYAHRIAYEVHAAAGDWNAALAAADLDAAEPSAVAGAVSSPAALARRARALRALGRLPDAAAAIAPTPLDCEDCVIERGLIAAAQGQVRLADHWLGEAVKITPTLPHANYAWGTALLARGDHDRAIAQFTEASRRGPDWADPLSGWGEALLAKGDAKGAARKFKAAARFAPNWGRNEMLWGEALAAQGKTAKAREHFEKARRMFLTPDEQARLARNLAGGVR